MSLKKKIFLESKEFQFVFLKSPKETKKKKKLIFNLSRLIHFKLLPSHACLIELFVRIKKKKKMHAQQQKPQDEQNQAKRLTSRNKAK